MLEQNRRVFIMNEKKRLKKSAYDRKICGVCGGIAEYLNLDVTVVRLLMVLVGCFSFGTGIIFYLIASVVMPEE